MDVSVPLNNILESATHTAVVVADFDGRINAFNQGAANLFGYTPEEAKNRNLPEITFSKEDQKSHLFEEIVDRVKSKGWAEERLFRQHKSGRLFPAISAITCLKHSTDQCEGILEITQGVPDLFRYTIADRFVILSHGEKVGDFKKAEITMEQLEHMIVTGRSNVN